ncbi:XRE family transcriptional regulator [Nitratireductor pacificus pht-3B]|uniref:XRE family transcriptional regulator n=2 Tax=Nitratireductor TaxID=245876 RepID=K2MJW0_9HYPH|nr:XRE family transcriptional regulator [Nitratireductor pacificus pht-3B]
MELALRLGFSARHISFVESGRAKPSRLLIESWLEEVDAQPSIRNAALHHAGFTPQSSAGLSASPAPPWNARLLEQLLFVHEPFPAFCFDADWKIRAANRGASWLMSLVMPRYLQTLRPGDPVDMIEACIHPDGLLSRMRDPGTVGWGLFRQLELESAATHTLHQRVRRLALSLEERFGTCPENGIAGCPVFGFDTARGRLDFFRFQSLMDLPQDVTLRSFRVEVSLPMDDHTKRVMQAAVHE